MHCGKTFTPPLGLMLIRPPQLQFFEDDIKITVTDTK